MGSVIFFFFLGGDFFFVLCHGKLNCSPRASQLYARFYCPMMHTFCRRKRRRCEVRRKGKKRGTSFLPSFFSASECAGRDRGGASVVNGLWRVVGARRERRKSGLFKLSFVFRLTQLFILLRGALSTYHVVTVKHCAVVCTS